MYLASRPEGADVAIKLFRKEVFGEPVLIKRLLRALHASSDLSHQYVVRTLDFGHLEDGVPYQVMEYVDGVALHRRLTTQGPLRATQALPLLIQLAEALHAIHSAWKVHGALGSRSLLLTNQEGGSSAQIKLLHLGLADVVRRAAAIGLYTQPSPTVFQDLPPDVLPGVRATRQRDIYGFGSVAFEMMTGDLSSRAAETTHLRGPSSDGAEGEQTTLPAGLPGSLSALVMRCLEVDPQLRPRDAEALLEDLRRIEQTVFKR